MRELMGMPDGRLVVPDGTSNYANSLEPLTPAKGRTKPYVPMGRSGDVVFRRLHVTVNVLTDADVSIRIMTYVDGRLEIGGVATMTRMTKGRHTWMIPLGRPPINRPGGYSPGSSGIRGSGIQVEIETFGPLPLPAVAGPRGPRGDWTLERVTVMYQPGLRSQRDNG
jgi:hypothetical protein